MTINTVPFATQVRPLDPKDRVNKGFQCILQSNQWQSLISSCEVFSSEGAGHLKKYKCSCIRFSPMKILLNKAVKVYSKFIRQQVPLNILFKHRFYNLSQLSCKSCSIWQHPNILKYFECMLFLGTKGTCKDLASSNWEFVNLAWTIHKHSY